MPYKVTAAEVHRWRVQNKDVPYEMVMGSTEIEERNAARTCHGV
jgi:hypothetical protein